MSARAELAALLTPLLPSKWLMVPDERNLDQFIVPVLRLSQQEIARHPAAPNSKLLITFTLRLIAPGTVLTRAEDDLDELVGMLLLVIETLPPVVAWSGPAQKVISSDRLAYDIPLTITVNAPR